MLNKNVSPYRYWDARYKSFGGPESVFNKSGAHRAMYLEAVSACLPVVNRKRNVRILDLGAGPGLMGYILHSRGHIGERDTYRAVDFSREAEKGFGEYFVGRNGYDFTRADLSYTLLPEVREEKWDLIICTKCLEHLTDDVKIVRMMIRLLDTDGRIVIAVPRYTDLSYLFSTRKYVTPSPITDLLKKSSLHADSKQVDGWWVISGDTRKNSWLL
jgi:SAM-dependent methyltransferase